MRPALLLTVSLAALAPAGAEAGPGETAEVAREDGREQHHTIYLELLGKTGLAGIGYDYRIGSHLALGAVGSAMVLDGDRLLSLSPYLGIHPLELGPHGLFVHAGAVATGVWTPSPVEEWSGRRSAGLGGQVTAGYEYRKGISLRAFLVVTAGKGGVAPWAGLDIGWPF